ncbi:uncharacterized protein Z519_11600 [Cladophialophora bantiana CBS 173.52]|uniref:Uncharacterized protein n=1 Tax=Cladophialophora bantiana (strain ATCC 10958 / CBS 173.52 / CDC B-1940 / NIH 8579) TaxID=1442370 RepID=A0A0D2EBZ6_CLAB1|nr:uncharacterized protein Z519_11600 [Cladophialophora bantiana CBS 173.52]KIW87626.1 hypothetical protein Z519_11600 [Cladophialophora bantiana CBS 173.52]
MASPELHTFSAHAETAVGAAASVYAAHELGKAFHDEDKHDVSDHYLKAAIGAAVAVGAFYHLSKKVEEYNDKGHPIHSVIHHHEPPRHRRHGGPHHHHHHHSDDNDFVGYERWSYEEPPHDRNRLLEQANEAYHVGKELLGEERDHVTQLFAEAIGAASALKDKWLEELKEHREHP